MSDVCPYCAATWVTCKKKKKNFFHKNREISILTMKKKQQG